MRGRWRIRTSRPRSHPRQEPCSSSLGFAQRRERPGRTNREPFDETVQSAPISSYLDAAIADPVSGPEPLEQESIERSPAGVPRGALPRSPPSGGCEGRPAGRGRRRDREPCPSPHHSELFTILASGRGPARPAAPAPRASRKSIRMRSHRRALPSTDRDRARPAASYRPFPRRSPW
jgi:hypothetical protein